MKFCTLLFATLCSVPVSGFTLSAQNSFGPTASYLNSMPPGQGQGWAMSESPGGSTADIITNGNDPRNGPSDVGPGRELVGMDIFPKYDKLKRIDGGGTVETFQMPPWTDCCQYYLKTIGRPLKAKVEMWVGPIRTTHTLKIDMDDGSETPYEGTLRFRKGVAPVIKISTIDANIPIWAGVCVPSVDRADELRANTEQIWETSGPDIKQKVQGANTDGTCGTNRYWSVPGNVEAVQLVAWSKDSGKKSFKVDIEVLQGPNSVRQGYYLQCGGGSQPYHAVLQTPGDGCAVRVRNKKFLEDGLVEFCVLPYEIAKENKDETTGFFL